MKILRTASAHMTLALVTTLLLLSIVGCGGQGSSSTTPGTAEQPAEQPPASATPPPAADTPAVPVTPPPAAAKSQTKPSHPAAAPAGAAAPAAAVPPAAAPPAPAAPAAPGFDMVAIPEGKNVTVILNEALSSKVGKSGDAISGTVKKDVQTRDHPMPIIPAGSVISGRIVEVQKATQMKGQAKLVVKFDTLTLPTGKVIPIVASIGAQGADTTARTATGMAGGAVAGAILGRIIGKDTKATVIGAVAGGAIGTGVVLGMDNKDIELPKGTDIMLNIDQSFDVPVPKRDA